MLQWKRTQEQTSAVRTNSCPPFPVSKRLVAKVVLGGWLDCGRVIQVRRGHPKQLHFRIHCSGQEIIDP